MYLDLGWLFGVLNLDGFTFVILVGVRHKYNDALPS